MSNPVDGDATPITSLRQLAEHIAEGCKPKERFGIGTEHEKFGFRLADLKTRLTSRRTASPARFATCCMGWRRSARPRFWITAIPSA
jgi:gamma-glutamylcysteine synthetase